MKSNILVVTDVELNEYESTLELVKRKGIKYSRALLSVTTKKLYVDRVATITKGKVIA